MKNNRFSVFLGLLALVGAGLACGLETGDANILQNGTERRAAEPSPKKLDAYEARGLRFAFYLIPAGLEREDLLETARKLHEKEPDTQLILVDDDSQAAEYIAYARSAGSSGQRMPREWADKHIVANVQKYLNGRWVLCEGYGFKEIAGLE